MADQKALLLDRDGNVVPVDPASVPDALQQGYANASPEQIKDYKLQLKYGDGLGNESTAAVAGFGRGLTFGASDQALTRTGLVKPETLKGYEDANPAASTAGEVAGAIAPIVLSDGAAAPEEAAGISARAAARFAPSTLVSGAGKAVEHAVAGALPTAGVDTLRAAAIKNAIAKGAGSMVEGAAYSAGHEVSEQALDPQWSAEAAMAHVGLGAMLGGALGAGIGVGETALPAAVSKAKSALGNMFGKAEGVLGDLTPTVGTAVGDLDNKTVMLNNRQPLAALDAQAPGILGHLDSATPEMTQWFADNAANPEMAEMLRALPKMGPGLARASPELADQMLNNWRVITTDTLEATRMQQSMAKGISDVLDTAESVGKKLHTQIKPAEMEAMLADVHPAQSAKALSNAMEQIQQAAADIRAEPEMYHGGTGRKLELLYEGLNRDLEDTVGSPKATMERLTHLRSQVDNMIPYGKDAMGMSPELKDTVAKLKDIRRAIKSDLVNPEYFGPQAARQMEIDDAVSQLAKATDKKTLFYKKLLTQNESGKLAVDPVKVETWIRQMGKGKGIALTDSHGRYIDAVKNLIRVAGDSAENGSVKFERAGLEGLINKTAEQNAANRLKATMTGRYIAQTAPNSLGVDLVAHTGIGQQVADKALGMVPGGGAVKAVLKGAANMQKGSAQVAALTFLERTGQAVGQKIEAGVNSIVKGLVRASYVGRGEAAAGMARIVAKSYEDRVKEFQKQTEMVDRLTSSPDSMNNALATANASIANHAPDTTTALSMTQAAALGFLKSKSPKHAKAGPMSPPWKPNRHEMMQWQQAHEVVHNPLSVLKKVRNGTLSQTHMEGLRQVYPQMLDRIQKQLTVELGKNPGKVDRKSLPGIGMILGVPPTGAYTPQAIQAAQATYAAKAGPAKTPQGGDAGAAKLTVGNRLATPQQQSSQRGT